MTKTCKATKHLKTTIEWIPNTLSKRRKDFQYIYWVENTLRKMWIFFWGIGNRLQFNEELQNMNSALLGTLQCIGSVLLCLGFNNQAPQCSLVHCMALKVLRSSLQPECRVLPTMCTNSSELCKKCRRSPSIANKCTLCANKFKFPTWDRPCSAESGSHFYNYI